MKVQPPGGGMILCPYCERKHNPKYNVVILDLPELDYCEGFPLTIQAKRGRLRWHYKVWARGEIGTTGTELIGEGISFTVPGISKRVNRQLLDYKIKKLFSPPGARP